MAAPKGNSYALGNTGGRPPFYKDAKEMADKIAEWIEYEDSLKKADAYSGEGKGVYTIEGCALYLGFASVQSLYDYKEKSEEFAYVLLRVKLTLTKWNPQKLY